MKAVTIEDLSRQEKESLCTGSGNWHTNSLAEKIATIHLSDGPHGLRAQRENASSNNDSIVATCFPTASASACSFDPELLREMAAAIANEAKKAGVSVVLGPGINIKRSPVCGRNFEYFSEDPYLAGELASRFVKGLQENGIAACVKHFAGNNQETHRMTSNSQIDERTLREIYLRAFEKVVKQAAPATIMASYNFLNGCPACENEWLLTQVLRNEWGFKGLVMSDWGACVDLAACVNAGMDLEMPDSHGNHNLLNVQDGALNRAASKVLELVNKYTSETCGELKEIPTQLLAEHEKLAKKIAIESAVLLKNDDVLPIKNHKKIVVIGDLAIKMRVQGGGSSHIHTRNLPTILDAFADEGIQTAFYQGYDSNSGNNDHREKDTKLLEKAIDGLKKELQDNPEIPVIIFGGLTDKAEGEGYDRESYNLPYNQIQLYEAIKSVTENVIFVSFGGSPYDISPIEYAKGILSMYLAGESAASACVQLLLGKENPCGRLAETWPKKLEDAPCFGNYGRQSQTVFDVKYTESLYVGYRFYDSFNIPVKYPFGYGLSYTSFAYDNLECKVKEQSCIVSLDVTNTGAMAGKETILIFVKNPEGDIIRAKRELRAFSKVFLEPGETKHVELELDNRAFDIYDVDNHSYIRVSGEYTIEASRNISDVLFETKMKVDGIIPGSQKEFLPSYFNQTKERFKAEDFARLYKKPLTDFSHIQPGQFTTKNSLIQMAPYSSSARILLKIGRMAVRFMTHSSLEDPESKMMLGGIEEGNIETVCNQSGGFISHKFIERIVSSANKNHYQ